MGLGEECCTRKGSPLSPISPYTHSAAGYIFSADRLQVIMFLEKRLVKKFLLFHIQGLPRNGILITEELTAFHRCFEKGVGRRLQMNLLPLGNPSRDRRKKEDRGTRRMDRRDKVRWRERNERIEMGC
ncbi:hypothetical protein JTE90_000303 [Oedothorax gibbosus]|uniref:Uncharacterized protein n=1 Tax=Oedothorax gibbosus TaxID=931172 RepID=A0AAV6VSE4_9ARAC|nr:hypothetical protein JTE90_000303 [Oedothorax gibbosus]